MHSWLITVQHKFWTYRHSDMLAIKRQFEQLGFAVDDVKSDYYNPTNRYKFVASHSNSKADTLWYLSSSVPPRLEVVLEPQK